MARSDIDLHFAKIDDLIDEINTLVPSTSAYRTVQFRADLAGLLVVSIAATYETCIKEILYEFANRHHASFGDYAKRNYNKINSRVAIKDLKRYCDLFDPAVRIRFNNRLSLRKKLIVERTGKNIETSYEQILDWRHEFAHTGNRNTTIEEATQTHRLAKRIIYIFDDCFHRP